MPDFSRRIFTLSPPADLPELHPYFAALASWGGYKLHFIIKDTATGETAVLQVEPPALGTGKPV